MPGPRSGWGFPVRVIIALIAALGTAAAAAGPAGAATRQAAPHGAHKGPAAAGFRESHLWTFGEGTVFGARPLTPQPIHGLPPGQHVVAAGFEPSAEFVGTGVGVFLLSNGTVWILPTPRPRQIPGLAGITAITVVGTTVYALSGTGSVYTWSGTGSATQVTGVANVTSVVNGYALESNGTVWALGGTTPVQVNVPAKVTQISSNPCGASSYALTSAGRVYAWGANNDGQLGDGTKTDSATPVLVHRVRNAAQVIGGCSDAYAIEKGSGSVMAWGLGSQGELGNGHRYTATLPVTVSGLTGVTSLTPGWYTTYAVLSDGTVWDWGFGMTGQLGYQPPGCVQPHNDPACYSAVPVQVHGLGAPIAYVAASDAIYTEQNYAVAVGQDGTLWGPWGGQFTTVGPSHQITRTPPLKPASHFWLNPFGGAGWGYAGAGYIAN